MIQRRHGAIICLTSSVVTNESPNLPGKGAVNVVYSTTKAALHRFAQGLVKEVREYNIPVVRIHLDLLSPSVSSSKASGWAG